MGRGVRVPSSSSPSTASVREVCEDGRMSEGRCEMSGEDVKGRCEEGVREV